MIQNEVKLSPVRNAGDSNLHLSLDALHPNDDVESLNLGVEYIYRNMIALRGGYRSLFARDSETGLTLGTGLEVKILGSFNFNVDYAYMDFGKLDNAQMVTLAMEF